MVHTDLSADSAAQTKEPELVFVYGSLMRGRANHRQMAGCRFAGKAILQGLALFDLGPFPMAIASGEPSHLLHGELYRMDSAQLAALDRFEGAPRLYERLRWPLADGRRVWIYLGRPQQVRFVNRLGDGIWRGRQP
jgi:gamma-glutamylcyclotransferase (GGCT)/AIG2-like uncharacterized protein YtfP